MNRHCAGCHRENGAAFSLTGYGEARPWAKAIRDEVLSRRMPPWAPVKGVGEFKGDASLSLPEIDMLVAWVEGGAPEGDPQLLPKPVPLLARSGAVPFRRTVEVASTLTLSSPATVRGLRASGLGAHQSMEAWATAPDGTVERLISLRDFNKIAARDYALRVPLRLPAGTKIRVSAPPGASLNLLCN